MNLLNMIEVVRQAFPDKQEAQVKMDLNNAYQTYSDETRLPLNYIDITGNGNVVEWDGTELASVRGWYTIPEGAYVTTARLADICGVVALDASNSEITIPEYRVEYVGNHFKMLDLNDNLYLGGGLPPGIACIRLHCHVSPAALAADTDTPDLPEQFHQAFIDHVLSKYFGYKGILQQSGWFRSSYQAQVMAGKRFFNRNIQ